MPEKTKTLATTTPRASLIQPTDKPIIKEGDTIYMPDPMSGHYLEIPAEKLIAQALRAARNVYAAAFRDQVAEIKRNTKTDK